MPLDMLVTVRSVAYSFVDLLDEDLFDEVHSHYFFLVAHENALGVADIIAEDFLPHHALAVVEKGRLLEYHFIENASEGPNVGLLPAPVLSQQLWSHIAG